jgi:DNA-binding XRE family transcriptional regulator
MKDAECRITLVAMRRPRFEENRSFYAALGRQIAQARMGRLTQDALAKKAALTRTSIINIEKGRQQVLVHTLVDIARALDISPADLLLAADDVEVSLRDKSEKGRDWIKKSTGALK